MGQTDTTANEGKVERGYTVICQGERRYVSTLKRPDMSKPRRVEIPVSQEEQEIIDQRAGALARGGSESAEYIRLSTRLYLLRHPEVLKKNKERNKRRYATDEEYRQRMIDRAREYHMSNPEKHAEYLSKRRKCPKYRGKVFCRNLIVSGIKKKRTTHGPKLNEARFERYVGCSLRQFHEHIERMFVNGMTWGNRGTKWVHRLKVGIENFDCSTEEGRKGACNWQNIKLMEVLGG